LSDPDLGGVPSGKQSPTRTLESQEVTETVARTVGYLDSGEWGGV
jgi:hypothetical protein